MTGTYGVMFRLGSQPNSGPLPYACWPRGLRPRMPSLAVTRDTSVRVGRQVESDFHRLVNLTSIQGDLVQASII